MKRNFWVVTSIIFIALSIVFGGLFFLQLQKSKIPTNKYPLLAKRLFQENPNDTIINFDPMRQDVRKYLESTNIPHSFYFEYLPTGSNVRIGETNELVGASLMKIPLVMDLYKAAELGKVNLDQEYTIQKKEVSTDEQYGNTGDLKVGDKITLRNAAKKTLIDSDNTTAELINEAIKDKVPESEHAIQNLDVESTTKTGSSGKFVLIGARPYSSFLKCLYFSCFVSKEHSQEILDSLTQATDSSRIKSGVPNNIPVAHKIGSFSKFTQSDCGIVYVPNRQYVLCLMLQAPEDKVGPHFKKVSEIVYNYVNTVN